MKPSDGSSNGHAAHGRSGLLSVLRKRRESLRGELYVLLPSPPRWVKFNDVVININLVDYISDPDKFLPLKNGAELLEDKC